MSIPVVLLMMRNSIRLLLLIVACLGLACLLQAEIRAIWVLPWSTNTPQKIDKFIADAACARQTDIMIEVRYRSDALYQTNRTPDPYPNPEPPSYILNGSDFDPLAYALEEAHKNNLRLHAWIVVFNATPTDSLRIRQNYIYTKSPIQPITNSPIQPIPKSTNHQFNQSPYPNQLLPEGYNQF